MQRLMNVDEEKKDRRKIGVILCMHLCSKYVFERPGSTPTNSLLKLSIHLLQAHKHFTQCFVIYYVLIYDIGSAMSSFLLN